MKIALITLTSLVFIGCSGCIPITSSGVSVDKPTAGPQTRPARAKGPKTYEAVAGVRLGNRTFAVDYYGKNVETKVGFGHLEGTKPSWAPKGYAQNQWVFVAATGGGQTGLIGLVIKKEASCIDGILEAITTTPISVKGWVLAPSVTRFGSLIEVDECQVGKSPYPGVVPAE